MISIAGLKQFGDHFRSLLNGQIKGSEGSVFSQHIEQARNYNHWYTGEAVMLRLQAITNYLFSEENLKRYEALAVLKNGYKPKVVGVHSEENIPLEEFSTLLAILLTGNAFIYHTNDRSDKLLPFVFNQLAVLLPDISSSVKFSDKHFKNINAIVISKRIDKHLFATGYFSKHPSLLEIRYPSVAIINGSETPEELSHLATDVFSFFGLGCGNVKKIFVPEGYDLKILFEAFEYKHPVIHIYPYANNYQYYQTVYLMNRIAHLDNGFLLLKEDKTFQSPTGVLYYEYYTDEKKLRAGLDEHNTFSYVYSRHPEGKGEKMFGESVNQLTFPSEQLIKFLS